MKGFGKKKNSNAHFIINTIIMLTLNNKHLPLLLGFVELDMFSSVVVDIRKKTRTIVSARKEENITVDYLEISLIKCDCTLQSIQKQRSRKL